jgi:FkbM family methyltransferase
MYLRYFPMHRGKGLLLRHLVLKALPDAPAQFEMPLPGGARIRLLYQETIGWSSLLYGPFEDAELQFLARSVRPGDIGFDVGANVGLYTVVLGRAVGPTGQVIAVEPVPANALRLREQVELNELKNVRVVSAAIGAAQGSIHLNLADDAAYASIGKVAEARGTGRTIEVPMLRLDDLWKEIGSPPVRFVKVDVEGAEADVLRGAQLMLRSTRPVLLLEANCQEALMRLKELLVDIGYTLTQPPGFQTHNYIAAAATSEPVN